jgi:serine/threonine protein kinase
MRSYVAPEVIQGFPYGKPSDIWSLGVLYYVLFCGYLHFNGMNMVCALMVAKSARQAGVDPCSFVFPRSTSAVR